jgi:hypothetical protein
MARTLGHIGARIAFAAAVCAIFVVAITARPPKGLLDFDQSFYLTIAYDLDRHGVFSNGIFDQTDSTRERPPPGMFFGPVYPALLWTAMKLDSRFAAAVTCVVESNERGQQGIGCEAYALPVHLIHALLLALGVIAVALAGERLFARRAVFWCSGLFATICLLPDADLFSFAMTESLTFALYSLVAYALVVAWQSARTRDLAVAGVLLGVLCLTRASFLALVPVVIVLTVLAARTRTKTGRASTVLQVTALAASFALVMVPWIARNAISVGKPGVTEEYGSVALIERFAYDDMTAREFLLAFPYCTPGIGDLAFDQVDGKDSMHRFVFHTRDSFFNTGRDLRNKLVEQHGRLDPIIRGIVADELRRNWSGYLLSSIPLAWCGMWVGWLAGLILLPLFVAACFFAVRRQRPLFLLYSVPPLTMLALHAAVANHYTRYNLILIGPFAVGSAWLIAGWLSDLIRTQTGAQAPDH